MRTLYQALLVPALLLAVPQSAQALTFTAPVSGDVVAYYTGGAAGYGITLGLLVDGVATGVTGLYNHGSNYGDSLNLGQADAGDDLTFFITIENSYTFYTNPALNYTTTEQAGSDAHAGDSLVPAGTYIVFDDTPYGTSYNDYGFVFRIENMAVAVPEPAMWATMLAGFGLVGGTLRRRRVMPAVTA